MLLTIDETAINILNTAIEFVRGDHQNSRAAVLEGLEAIRDEWSAQLAGTALSEEDSKQLALALEEYDNGK
jgi:predicted RNA methylase